MQHTIKTKQEAKIQFEMSAEELAALVKPVPLDKSCKDLKLRQEMLMEELANLTENYGV